MLEVMDRTLRDFVAAFPQLAVALVADRQAASLAVVAPQRFGRRLMSLLAGTCSPPAKSDLLLVRLALRGPAVSGAQALVSVIGPSAKPATLCWPCKAVSAVLLPRDT